MGYISKLPVKAFIKLVIKLYEDADERKAWEMWLARYQHMTKDDYVSFESFYSKAPEVLYKESAEDILADVESIRSAFKRGETSGNF
jgi:hypothetical protein